MRQAFGEMTGLRYAIAPTLIAQTFAELRKCGSGHRECQILWTSPWTEQERILRIVHPDHSSSGGGFQLNSQWLTRFAFELEGLQEGVRVQVHTHPGRAFHSSTDDRFPMVSTPGFLSLVIPNFAQGPVGFKDAYLTELQPDGCWMQVTEIEDRIRILPPEWGA